MLWSFLASHWAPSVSLLKPFPRKYIWTLRTLWPSSQPMNNLRRAFFIHPWPTLKKCPLLLPRPLVVFSSNTVSSVQRSILSFRHSLLCRSFAFAANIRHDGRLIATICLQILLLSCNVQCLGVSRTGQKMLNLTSQMFFIFYIVV